MDNLSLRSGKPLYVVSPERVNSQRISKIHDTSADSPTNKQRRENGVHDKVAAFNNLSLQSRILERKTNDAALKRAVLGREEAESELRRYKEETRNLKKAVEDGHRRERIVGERLESLMERFGRSKENIDHTKAVWEKEIRRAKKESFKMQSVLVQTQEELKYARAALKRVQTDLERERTKITSKEQEALDARYQLAQAQEEISRVKKQLFVVEKERDVLRTIAKNEEILRMAAEGQIPLPISNEDDDFASPKKSCKSSELIITRSAVSEELDDLRMRLAWEQQCTRRAYDRIEFLETECRFNCCASRAASQKNKTEVARPLTLADDKFKTMSPVSHESPWAPQFQENYSLSVQPSYSLNDRLFTRTPSCEPLAPALEINKRTSLLSLLGSPETASPLARRCQEEDVNNAAIDEPTLSYKTKSTTVLIPLARSADTFDPEPVDLLEKHNISTICPTTISREEALAQIRERRGRARSLAQGTMTPKRHMSECVRNRRDISEPAIRSGSVVERKAIQA